MSTAEHSNIAFIIRSTREGICGTDLSVRFSNVNGWPVDLCQRTRKEHPDTSAVIECANNPKDALVDREVRDDLLTQVSFCTS